MKAGLSRWIFARTRPNVDRCCLHGDRDFAAQTLRLEDEPRLASELSRNASFDLLGPEAMLILPRRALFT